jgi:hypothetical protein
MERTQTCGIDVQKFQAAELSGMRRTDLPDTLACALPRHTSMTASCLAHAGLVQDEQGGAQELESAPWGCRFRATGENSGRNTCNTHMHPYHAHA